MNKQAQSNFEYLLALHNDLMRYLTSETKMFNYSKARVVLKRYGANGSVLQLDIPHAILDIFELQEDLGTTFEISMHVNKDNQLKIVFQQGYGYRPKKLEELTVDMTIVNEQFLCEKIISMIDFLITADETSDYFDFSPVCNLDELKDVLNSILNDIIYDLKHRQDNSNQ